MKGHINTLLDIQAGANLFPYCEMEYKNRGLAVPEEPYVPDMIRVLEVYNDCPFHYVLMKNNEGLHQYSIRLAAYLKEESLKIFGEIGS